MEILNTLECFGIVGGSIKFAYTKVLLLENGITFFAKSRADLSEKGKFLAKTCRNTLSLSTLLPTALFFPLAILLRPTLGIGIMLNDQT